MALPKSTDETVLRMKGNMGAIISCADPKAKIQQTKIDVTKIYLSLQSRASA